MSINLRGRQINNSYKNKAWSYSLRHSVNINHVRSLKAQFRGATGSWSVRSEWVKSFRPAGCKNKSPNLEVTYRTLVRD